jgi:hypothetical protein
MSVGSKKGRDMKYLRRAPRSARSRQARHPGVAAIIGGWLPIICAGTVIGQSAPESAAGSSGPAAELMNRYRVAMHSPPDPTEPRAHAEGTALLVDLLDAIRRSPSVAEAQPLREAAAQLAFAIGDHPLALDLARARSRALIEFQESVPESPHHAASRFVVRGAAIDIGISLLSSAASDRPAVPAPSPAGWVDHQRFPDVLADVRAQLSDWRTAFPIDDRMVSPSVLHRTLVRCADFLGQSGFPAEAADAYADATAYAELIDDSTVISSFNPAYTTALRVVAALDAGDLDGAARSVEKLMRMPPQHLTSRGNEVRSPAFYLSLIVTRPASTTDPADFAQRKLDLVLPMVDRLMRSGIDQDLIVLVTNIADDAAGTRISDNTARLSLRYVDDVLAQHAPLRAADESWSGGLMRRLPHGTAATGYALRPVTASLLVSKFRLARKLGDESVAEQTAEKVLADFPNSPAMPMVARWMQRRTENRRTP